MISSDALLRLNCSKLYCISLAWVPTTTTWCTLSCLTNCHEVVPASRPSATPQQQVCVRVFSLAPRWDHKVRMSHVSIPWWKQQARAGWAVKWCGDGRRTATDLASTRSKPAVTNRAVQFLPSLARRSLCAACGWGSGLAQAAHACVAPSRLLLGVPTPAPGCRDLTCAYVNPSPRSLLPVSWVSLCVYLWQQTAYATHGFRAKGPCYNLPCPLANPRSCFLALCSKARQGPHSHTKT